MKLGLLCVSHLFFVKLGAPIDTLFPFKCGLGGPGWLFCEAKMGLDTFYQLFPRKRDPGHPLCPVFPQPKQLVLAVLVALLKAEATPYMTPCLPVAQLLFVLPSYHPQHIFDLLSHIPPATYTLRPRSPLRVCSLSSDMSSL